MTTKELDSKLDEVLQQVFNAGYLDGSKPEDYRNRLSSVLQVPEAKQSLKQLLLEVGEEQILEFAKEADKEYPRSEIDRWLFSLGAVVHNEIIRIERLHSIVGGEK